MVHPILVFNLQVILSILERIPNFCKRYTETATRLITQDKSVGYYSYKPAVLYNTYIM